MWTTWRLRAREFAKLCPGFETDIHGLVEIEDDEGNVRYYADCVAEPGGPAGIQGQQGGQGPVGPGG